MIKWILFGPLAGMFQLINLWVCYTAYATMHFCSVIIYMIICGFDLMFASLDWNRLQKKNEGNTSGFETFLFTIMVIFYLVAIFQSYRTYSVFKELFIQQIGDPYQMQHDEEYDPYRHHGNDENYHEQQQRLRQQHTERMRMQQL